MAEATAPTKIKFLMDWDDNIFAHLVDKDELIIANIINCKGNFSMMNSIEVKGCRNATPEECKTLWEDMETMDMEFEIE